MLFQAPSLDPRELEVLARIDDLKNDLKFRLYEPRRWMGSFRRLAAAKAVQGSNSIEGYNASDDDAAAVIEGEEPLDANVETRHALFGYRDAMTYVLQIANDPAFVYSTQLVQALHFMMVKHDLGKRPGQWRVGDIYVKRQPGNETVHVGASADKLNELMSELATDLQQQSDLPTIVRAGMAHLNLVMIHPFKDGNGRMGRCLQTLVLARQGILDPRFSSIEEYLGHNTETYYAVLGEVGKGAWNPQNDARAWVRFVLTAHLRQATTTLQRVAEFEELWDMMETLAADSGVPERAVPALFDASRGWRIRNPTYRAVQPEESPISEQVATIDLGRLVKAKLLEPRGSNRGRYYVASGDLRSRWKTIRDKRPKNEADPFAG